MRYRLRKINGAVVEYVHDESEPLPWTAWAIVIVCGATLGFFLAAAIAAVFT